MTYPWWENKRHFQVVDSTKNNSNFRITEKSSDVPWPNHTVMKNAACHFPDLNPWHSSLTKYITNKTVSVSCPQTQPNLTYVDTQGFLIFNQSQFEQLVYWSNANAEGNGNGTEQFGIDCFYQTFDRAPGLNDSKVSYSPKRQLNAVASPIALDEDMVEVFCDKSKIKERLSFLCFILIWATIKEVPFP
uniref:Uncharacterized protein n=1 Tax=Romanomermis culicivorax TaxID=13658 RepID=A0A915KW80_ROMCU